MKIPRTLTPKENTPNPNLTLYTSTLVLFFFDLLDFRTEPRTGPNVFPPLDLLDWVDGLFVSVVSSTWRMTSSCLYRHKWGWYTVKNARRLVSLYPHPAWLTWPVGCVGCGVCGMWDYPVGLPVKIITSPNSSDSTFNSPVSWSCKVWVDVCGVGHENDTCVSLCVCDLPVLSIDFL